MRSNYLSNCYFSFNCRALEVRNWVGAIREKLIGTALAAYSSLAYEVHDFC